MQVERVTTFTSQSISHLQATGRIAGPQQVAQQQQQQQQVSQDLQQQQQKDENQDQGKGRISPAIAQAGLRVLTQRRRPFIYVYDLPPAYNARMLQYRVEKYVRELMRQQSLNLLTI
jgi:hypothetical protein